MCQREAGNARGRELQWSRILMDKMDMGDQNWTGPRKCLCEPSPRPLIQIEDWKVKMSRKNGYLVCVCLTLLIALGVFFWPEIYLKFFAPPPDQWFREMHRSWEETFKKDGWVRVDENTWRHPSKGETNITSLVITNKVIPSRPTARDPAARGTGKINQLPEPVVILTISATVDESAKKTPISVWRSADSTADERANAVNKLLSPETSIQSAEALLGKDGRFSHYFGPSFKSVRETNYPQAGVINDAVLEYGTARGVVSLVFSRGPGATNHFRFVRAFAGRY